MYGSHAGAIVLFLNRLADRIAPRHPDVRLDTLAYLFSLDPPRDLRLRDNVVVRLANLQYRDFLRPATHPANDRYRRAIEGWAEAGPFDAVVLNGVVEHIPRALYRSLKPGGRILAPVGTVGEPQSLILSIRGEETPRKTRPVLTVRFGALPR